MRECNSDEERYYRKNRDVIINRAKNIMKMIKKD